MLKEFSISDYLKKLSSSEPTPGAGCAAAITGAQGVALLIMVCNLTLGKKKYLGVQKEVIELMDVFEKVRLKVLDLAEADTIAFDSLITAYKLPKETKEEKEIRSQKIEEALKLTANVPLTLLDVVTLLIPPALRLADICNKKVKSDVQVAMILIDACVSSCRINIEYNLKLIKDRSYCREIKMKMKK
jgi:methenyltetrahydrofolate cyclohydrolase